VTGRQRKQTVFAGKAHCCERKRSGKNDNPLRWIALKSGRSRGDEAQIKKLETPHVVSYILKEMLDGQR
jgi:hypothetical protein